SLLVALEDHVHELLHIVDVHGLEVIDELGIYLGVGNTDPAPHALLLDDLLVDEEVEPLRSHPGDQVLAEFLASNRDAVVQVSDRPARVLGRTAGGSLIRHRDAVTLRVALSLGDSPPATAAKGQGQKPHNTAPEYRRAPGHSGGHQDTGRLDIPP